MKRYEYLQEQINDIREVLDGVKERIVKIDRKVDEYSVNDNVRLKSAVMNMCGITKPRLHSVNDVHCNNTNEYIKFMSTSLGVNDEIDVYMNNVLIADSTPLSIIVDTLSEMGVNIHAITINPAYNHEVHIITEVKDND